MVSDTPCNWTQAMLEDIFRLQIVQEHTTFKTKRLMLVVAQRRFIEKEWLDRYEGFLSNVLPMPGHLQSYGIFERLKNTIKGTTTRNVVVKNFPEEVKSECLPRICKAIGRKELPSSF